MAEPMFDKDGNLANLGDLTAEQVHNAYQTKNKELFGRLQDEKTKREQAEAEKQRLETEQAEREKNAKKPEPKAESSDPERLELIARGLSDEEIDEAQAIAKGRGISLKEAVKHPSFKLFQDNFKEQQRRERAKLGASKGSGEGGSGEGEDDVVVTPGMSEAEHRKMFKKQLGKVKGQ